MALSPPRYPTGALGARLGPTKDWPEPGCLGMSPWVSGLPFPAPTAVGGESPADKEPLRPRPATPGLCDLSLLLSPPEGSSTSGEEKPPV